MTQSHGASGPEVTFERMGDGSLQIESDDSKSHIPAFGISYQKAVGDPHHLPSHIDVTVYSFLEHNDRRNSSHPSPGGHD